MVQFIRVVRVVQVSSWSAFIICIQKIVLFVVVCCIFQSRKSCRKFIGSQGGLRAGLQGPRGSRGSLKGPRGSRGRPIGSLGVKG